MCLAKSQQVSNPVILFRLVPTMPIRPPNWVLLHLQLIVLKAWEACCKKSDTDTRQRMLIIFYNVQYSISNRLQNSNILLTSMGQKHSHKRMAHDQAIDQ